jgi:hypothetical protein
MFSDKSSPKSAVILENNIINNMILPENKQDTLEPIDNLVLKSFVDKFNEKYQTELLENQKNLLNHYITSFVDNGLGLKMFLNSEIARLKEELTNSLDTKVIKEDTDLVEKTNQVLEKLSSFQDKGINESAVLTILKTQQLAQEINADGN